MKRIQVTLALAVMLVAGMTIHNSADSYETYTVSLQSGQYTAYDVDGPYSGLMREDGSSIGPWDDISVFGWPEHVEADLLWFTSGWMAWDYLIDIPDPSEVQSLAYTVEISSEHPGAMWDWPSEITVNIGGLDIGTWMIPGDPDDTYGFAYQENSLGSGSSQYGWLTTWTVDGAGTYLDYKFRMGDMPDKVKVSDVTISDIEIIPGEKLNIMVSIPYTPSGFGLNIYGDTWGDYDYDPTVMVHYRPVTIVLVDIRPETLNLKSGGEFTAFIDLPEGYNGADIDVDTVECEGAPALKGMMADDGRFIAKFDREDLDDVPTGEAVELTVTGELNDGTLFGGSDIIRVIGPGKPAPSSKGKLSTMWGKLKAK